jgi:hypothetical protein
MLAVIAGIVFSVKSGVAPKRRLQGIGAVKMGPGGPDERRPRAQTPVRAPRAGPPFLALAGGALAKAGLRPLR